MKQFSRSALVSIRSSSATPPQFICLRCQHRAAQIARTSAFSTSISKLAEHQEENPSYAERLRRRIWGTNTPLGEKDPYGGEGKIAEAVKKRQQAAKPAANHAESISSREVINKEVVRDTTNYKPATTWDGLEHIGGPTGWWEADWDEQHPFEGFMVPTKMLSHPDIAEAIRRAVIEAYVLKNRHKNIHSAIQKLRKDDFSIDVDNVKISQASDGSITLLPSDGTGPGTLILGVQDSKLLPSSWLTIPLRDEKIKFAIFKRTMQLTGIRIQDNVIEDIDTPKALLSHLAKKPKPKKLAEVLTTDENLASIPNLQILGRRYTPIDKEQEVGRWKVIEKELVRRGLPVTGRV